MARCIMACVICCNTRAGHSSLKASLSRFNIVSTAECECGDELQAEKHIFWGCKRYEEQGATVMDTLSENCKTEYPKSLTELLRLEEKRFVLGIHYFINKISSQQEAVACVWCTQKESHCCEG
jgi:hypothetical protein